MATEKKRILIIGAGVIGSLCAGKLSQAGHTIDMLARGVRLQVLLQSGLVLRDARTGKTERILIRAIDHLEASDSYDWIVVCVRANQVHTVLPLISTPSISSNILFMVNHFDGYAGWLEALGPGRLVIGFPGAGGTLTQDAVEYTIVSRWLQPTTFGNPEGGRDNRVREISGLFREAGFSTALFDNMDAWQKYHVAWVTPLALAIERAAHKGAHFSDEPELIRLSISGVREGFSLLQLLGYRVSPPKLNLIKHAPLSLIFHLLRAWGRTAHFETVAVRHSLSAHDEIRFLAARIIALSDLHGVGLPSLRRLYDKN